MIPMQGPDVLSCTFGSCNLATDLRRVNSQSLILIYIFNYFRSDFSLT